jgi:hypothetical protein
VRRAANDANAQEVPGETCLVMAANGAADSSFVYTRQLDDGLEISWWPVTAPRLREDCVACHAGLGRRVRDLWKSLLARLSHASAYRGFGSTEMNGGGPLGRAWSCA